MEKIKLLGHTLAQLKDIAVGLGLPGFVGKQMADWLYKKRITQIDHMTNLSKAAREKLNERYVVGRSAYTQVTVSKDGTKKYLFPSHTGTFIETVMIPADDRYTLCVSSQAGCKMGCKFCMTGRMGFKGNLEVAEIISQYLEVDENNLLTNTVFMGMGEPLDNLDNVLQAIEVLTSDWGFGWSPKRITLSTIGGNAGNESPLYRFLNESKAHLAVSLHNPLPDERALIMPMEKPFPIHRTLEIIRQYDFTGQRRVSFEYIMFNHFNDTKAHADAIARLLRGLECRVNLIRFHAIPDSPLETSPMPVIEAFKERLNAAGVTATVRASRGEDVFAACGMLSTRKNPIKR